LSFLLEHAVQGEEKREKDLLALFSLLEYCLISTLDYALTDKKILSICM
jgi:hypothetical protein